MGAISKRIAALKQDPNLIRVRRGIVSGARGTPAGAKRYFINKVPIVQWIGGYSPKWLAGDVIAGTSVGMLMLPQALIVSFLAGVPIQQALVASWLPGVIYTVMGTAKGDISPHSAQYYFRLMNYNQILVPGQQFWSQCTPEFSSVL